jgi:hypothetical protein
MDEVIRCMKMDISLGTACTERDGEVELQDECRYAEEECIVMKRNMSCKDVLHEVNQ